MSRAYPTEVGRNIFRRPRPPRSRLTMEELTMVRISTQRSGRWFAWLNWWTCLCLPAFGFAFVMWGAVTTLYVSLAVAFLTTLVLIGISGESNRPDEAGGTTSLGIVRIPH